MKKSHLYSLLLCASLVAGSCERKPVVPENEFLIQGKLENVPDSVVIELRISDGRLLKLVTSDTLVNGRFTLRDTITADVRELLLMSDGKGFPGTWSNVWVAPGKHIKISGKDKLLKTWKIESDIPEQAAENSYLKVSFPEQQTVLEYKAEEDNWIRRMYGEGPQEEAFIKQGWKQIDSLRKLEAPLEATIFKKQLDYLKTAPVTTVWLKHFQEYASRLQWDNENPHIPEIKELYARLSESDKQTEYGRQITEYMNLGTVVNVGDRMVDDDLYDPEGNLHHLSEFKGRYILLDFWSSGCGPCIQSIPEMEEITEMYKDKMAVVSICEDTKENWLKSIAERKMTGNQWNELRRARTGLAARYQVVGIPHYVLISPDGTIKSMWSGYGKGALKEKLKDLVE